MRTRDLRPGLFENELLGTADDFISLLFAGLTLLADPRGVLEDRPLKIKAKLFPYKERDVSAGLDELARLGFIERYQVDEYSLILIVKFTDHQRCHPKERNNSFPLPSRGSAVAKHGAAVNRFEPCKIPKEEKEKKEEKIQEGGCGRKPKKIAARYREADRRGNERTQEPDFANVFLSNAERERARARFIERGLKPEFHSDAFELLNASLSRGNNLRDSVEHYSSLTGWALREALKNQAQAERTAKISTPVTSTPQDETIRRIRDYGRRAGSDGNPRNHSFDVSGIPAFGASHAAMVPNVREDSSRRHPLGFGPFHQDEHRATCADHQPAFCFAPGDEPGTGAEVCSASGEARRGATCDAGEVSPANDRRSQEVSSPVRQLASPGASFGLSSGNTLARRA